MTAYHSTLSVQSEVHTDERTGVKDSIIIIVQFFRLWLISSITIFLCLKRSKSKMAPNWHSLINNADNYEVNTMEINGTSIGPIQNPFSLQDDKSCSVSLDSSVIEMIIASIAAFVRFKKQKSKVANSGYRSAEQDGGGTYEYELEYVLKAR